MNQYLANILIIIFTTKVPITTTTTTSKPSFKSSSTCGVSQHAQNLNDYRIINGIEANPYSWPWVVSISLDGPEYYAPHICGGTLINRRYVITAGHCLDEKTIYEIVGNPVKNSADYSSATSMVRIHIGIYNTETDEVERNNFKAESFKFLNGNRFNNKDDLALIKLSQDVVLSDKVGFICLTSSTNTSVGASVYAVGWGLTNPAVEDVTPKLRQVKLRILPIRSCQWSSYNRKGEFCAGDPNLKRDTCQGDSGGPLMEQISTKNSNSKVWVLVGITSYGDISCGGSGVYTNVSYYYDWIMENSKI